MINNYIKTRDNENLELYSLYSLFELDFNYNIYMRLNSIINTNLSIKLEYLESFEVINTPLIHLNTNMEVKHHSNSINIEKITI